VHSSRKNYVPLSAAPPAGIPISHDHPKDAQDLCLSILPTSTILRSYVITRMSSSPVLLGAIFTLLRKMLDSNSMLLNPDKNFILRWIFKNTFYAQFCAGENKAEVRKNITEVKRMGYTGVILEYALEVLGNEGAASADNTAAEIEVWRKGMLETVAMASPGDFVGLK
jgi:hypothetical protein